MPFRWQINASDVSKLIGVFKKYQTEALAKTWRKNLLRMPRFGVRPSTNFQEVLRKRQQKQTKAEAVEEKLQAPEMQHIVEAAVTHKIPQKQAIQQLQQTADLEVKQNTQKLTETRQEIARLVVTQKKVIPLKNFNTIKSGIKRTKLLGFFMVKETRIYQKTSRATAKRKTQDDARDHGYCKPIVLAKIHTKIVKKQAEQLQQLQTVQKAQIVQKNIKKIATTRIQTSKGIQAEDKDLKQVQKKAPTVRSGNTKSYFYNVPGTPYGAFVIGKIDGFDEKTRTVIELKHRTRGLFNHLRDYEKVQCFLYMKMLKVHKAKLIETYEGSQREYNIKWDESFWQMIKKGLLDALEQLNAAEKNNKLREKWINEIL